MLRWLFETLHRKGRVSPCPRGPSFLHHSRTPGRPEIIARMRPVALMRTAVAFTALPQGERERHWLASDI